MITSTLYTIDNDNIDALKHLQSTRSIWHQREGKMKEKEISKWIRIKPGLGCLKNIEKCNKAKTDSWCAWIISSLIQHKKHYYKSVPIYWKMYIFYIESYIFPDIILYLKGLFLNVQAHNQQMSCSLFWNELTYKLFTVLYQHFSWISSCEQITKKFSFNFYLCYTEKRNGLISPNLLSKFSTCTPDICIYLALGLPQFHLFTWTFVCAKWWFEI